MRLTIAIPLLLVMCANAHARSPRPQTDTPDFAVELCTSTTINVSSSAAVNISTGSVALSSATFIEAYNADSGSAIILGYDANVSTASADGAYGREIPPQTGVGLLINLDKMNIFLRSQKSTDSRATITKCR